MVFDLMLVAVWETGDESAEQVGGEMHLDLLGGVVWKRFCGFAVLISRGVTRQAMSVACCSLA